MPDETKPLEKLCRNCAGWKHEVLYQGECQPSLELQSARTPSSRSPLVTSANSACLYPLSFKPVEQIQETSPISKQKADYRNNLSLESATGNSMSACYFMQNVLLQGRAR